MAKEVKPKIETFARIKVIGIGGAGGAAVNRMIDSGVKDLEFIVVNTDAQALSQSRATNKINIGKETTRGLGAGSDPLIGQQAAEESIEVLKEAIKGADMLFIALGAGGGTGSGAAPVVARLAKEMGILTVAFATRPFRFEGEKREKNAEFAISNLEDHVDTLVLIPNNKLLEAIDPKTPLSDAFKIADDVLRQGVQGISDLITVPGMINLDFADVKAIMQESGQALMGIGRASGDDRAEIAARQAIESPLLDVSIDGARGVLFNVIGGNDMTMHEINAAAAVITEVADQDVNVIFGATVNPDLDGEIIVTVVATGFSVNYSGSGRSRVADVSQASTDGDDDGVYGSSADEAKLSRRQRRALKSGSSRSPEADEDQQDNIDEIVKGVDMSLAKSRSRRVIDDYGAGDDEDDEDVWDDQEDDGDDEDIDQPTFLRKIRRTGKATQASGRKSGSGRSKRR